MHTWVFFLALEADWRSAHVNHRHCLGFKHAVRIYTVAMWMASMDMELGIYPCLSSKPWSIISAFFIHRAIIPAFFMHRAIRDQSKEVYYFFTLVWCCNKLIFLKCAALFYSNRSICIVSFKGRGNIANWPIREKNDIIDMYTSWFQKYSTSLHII